MTFTGVNIEEKYLISQLDFLSKSNFLVDNCNNTWVNNGIEDKNILVNESAYNYFNKLNTLASNTEMRCLCLKTQKQENFSIIPSISNQSKIVLGGRSFTIDFWMNMTTEEYYKENFLEDITSQISILWKYNKSVKSYNELVIYPYGFTMTYCDNKIKSEKKRYKQLFGIIKETPEYFNNSIYDNMKNKFSFYHVIISYNTQYSSNHPDMRYVLNFYIDGMNYIDQTQYKSIPVIRNDITISFKNYNNKNEQESELYISRFRIWDGMAIETDNSTGKLIMFEDNKYNNYYKPDRYMGYSIQYDNMNVS